MKKMLCFIISMLIALSFSISTNAIDLDDTKKLTVTGSEYDLFCDDFYYHILDNGTAEITKYVGTNEDLYIPDSLANHIVTAIDIQSKNINVLNIHLGKHISSFYCTTDSPLENIYVDNQNEFLSSDQGILYSADMTELLYIPSMSKITALTIPDSVIKVSALPYSKNMTNLTIGKNVIQTVELDYNLTSVVYYEQMEKINVDSGNPYYRSENGIVYWHDAASETDRYAFPPSNRTTSFNVPDGQKYLGRNELQHCKYLEDLYLPNGLEIVGYEFYNNKSLRNIFVSSDNELYCSIDGVLYNKAVTEMLIYPPLNSMTDYTIPESVTNVYFDNISSSSLSLNSSLKSITLSKNISDFRISTYWKVVLGNLEKIYVDNPKYYSKDGILFSKGTDYDSVVAYPQCNPTKVFELPEGNPECWFGAAGCKYLEEVRIPASITSIPYFNSFVYAEYLKRIVVDENNPSYCDIDGVLYSKDKKTLIRYPRGKTDSTYVFPDEIEAFNELAIWGNPYLINLTIPDNITSLRLAISSCENLREITIPKSVTEIRSLGWNCADPGGHGTYTKNDDLVIKGYTYSVAESYARDEGFQFVSIGKADKLLGDADGDDSVTILDATVIQRHLAEIPTAVYIEAAADADQDRSVTIIDATAIQRWLVQLPSNENIGKVMV